MDGTTVERQKLIEAVSTLPDEVLLELASFLDYLRYKSVQQKEPDNKASSFLLSVAGLGNSSQHDVSERDEEILRNEIDPVYGWNLKPNGSTWQRYSTPVFCLRWPNRGDRNHERVLAAAQSVNEVLVLPVVVLPEICYLIASRLGHKAMRHFVFGSKYVSIFSRASLSGRLATGGLILERQFPVGLFDRANLPLARKTGTNLIVY